MNPNDEELKTMLRTWQPKPIDATEIRRAVWQRIEQEESCQQPRWVAFLIDWLSRPAIAVALFLVAIGVGAAFGTAATSQAQTTSYLQTMSPFLHLGQ